MVFSRQCFPTFLSRVLAALLATQAMLGFSLWCAVLLLHWSAKQAGPPAARLPLYLLPNMPWAACCKRSFNRHLVMYMVTGSEYCSVSVSFMNNVNGYMEWVLLWVCQCYEWFNNELLYVIFSIPISMYVWLIFQDITSFRISVGNVQETWGDQALLGHYKGHS